MQLQRLFTWRDLFWLLLVVGILCMWWWERERQNSFWQDYVDHLQSNDSATQVRSTDLQTDPSHPQLN